MSVLPALILASLPATADASKIAPLASEITDNSGLTQAYLQRRAVLLMIRSTFDVLRPNEVEPALIAEIDRIGADGPSQSDLAALDRDLLAEGSYYLVSLKYVIEVGGAAWPPGRAEGVYVRETLSRLDDLQNRLVRAVRDRADPLPIMLEAQAILALTEGEGRGAASFDHFAGRDAMVERVLAEHGPRVQI